MYQLYDFVVNNKETFAVIIAGLALILSFSSTILTLFSVSLQRKHNRVSVKPLVICDITDSLNQVSVKIQNNGLGPLIIKKFEVFENNKYLNDNLIELMPESLETVFWGDFVQKINNRVIRQGEELTILQLSGSVSSPTFINFRDVIRRTLSRFTIRIHYESLYKEKQPIYERNLLWFSRNSL